MTSHSSLHMVFFSVLASVCLATFPNDDCNIRGCFIEETMSDLSTYSSELTSEKKSLLIVSTLDGTISAVDGSDGTLIWSQKTEPGELLSSSISNIQLISKDKTRRLIPSLEGDLYVFDGETIEPIPVSADSLLEAPSFLSDDIVISGGKEKQVYGIDMITGRIHYVCGMDRCTPPSAEANQELLLVSRITQTVRAVEIRTGVERWNFSVGRHDIAADINYDDAFDQSFRTLNIDFPDLSFAVSDHILHSYDPENLSTVIWSKEFESPVVSAWFLSNGHLKKLDLPNWEILDSAGTVQNSQALIYVGLHNGMLYVQDSPFLIKEAAKKQDLLSGKLNLPKIAWKPYLITEPGKERMTATWKSKVSDKNKNEYAKERPYIGKYTCRAPDDKHYTYFDCDEDHCEDLGNTTDGFAYDGFPFPEKFPKGFYSRTVEYIVEFPISLVLVFAIALVVIAFSFSRRFRVIESEVYDLRQLLQHYNNVVNLNSMLAIRLAEQTRRPLPPCDQNSNHISDDRTAAANSVACQSLPSSSSLPNSRKDSTSEEYSSRYLNDFETLSCLGKGGFGVVFEARNKLDDVRYAVKRVSLPLRPRKREKVIREVKALANLDHPNIVRYFNSWLEEPPAGFMSDHDSQWIPRDNAEISESSRIISAPACRRRPIKIPQPFGFEEVSYLSNSKDTAYSDSGMLVFEHNTNSQCEDSELSLSKIKSSNREKIPFSHSSEKLDLIDTHSMRKTRSPFVISQSDSDLNANEEEGWRNHRLDVESFERSEGTSKKGVRPILYIQMQLCQKTTLREWLSNTTSRSKGKILRIFNQMVHGIEYVHNKNMIHRDLKPSNIFFSAEDHIKIGDFGLATQMVEDEDDSYSGSSSKDLAANVKPHTTQVGTQMYMSPEQINGKPYNYKVDIYSLGLILFELLVPFSTDMERAITIKELKQIKFPKQFSDDHPKEKLLLELMLDHDPESRPTTYGIRARPPLRELQDPSILEVPEEMHFHLGLGRG
ncbi:eukaryotic translation initiation factor 2-alpha kinase-like isoform X2 [Artemia franciscana]|uniref:eukaryotic translation initiation factor 2-alpha kinase-like isoform X2 n=1 Tax=Artemia franciscana TaxID=6661 RepID=UPI0032DAA237